MLFTLEGKIMNIRILFYGAFSLVLLYLLLSVAAFSPAVPQGSGEGSPPSPARGTTIIGFVVYAALIFLACVSTVTALKRMEGLRMVISIAISWLIPLFGPFVVFMAANSSSAGKTLTSRSTQ